MSKHTVSLGLSIILVCLACRAAYNYTFRHTKMMYFQSPKAPQNREPIIKRNIINSLPTLKIVYGVEGFVVEDSER